MANPQNPLHYAKFIKIRADGKEYPTLEGTTFRKNGMERETVAGSEVYGYTEKAVSAKVDADVPANYETDFEAINNAVNVTIEVEMDTGQIYLMANAWNTLPIEVNDGKFKISFEAIEATRIT